MQLLSAWGSVSPASWGGTFSAISLFQTALPNGALVVYFSALVASGGEPFTKNPEKIKIRGIYGRIMVFCSVNWNIKPP